MWSLNNHNSRHFEKSIIELESSGFHHFTLTLRNSCLRSVLKSNSEFGFVLVSQAKALPDIDLQVLTFKKRHFYPRTTRIAAESKNDYVVIVVLES